MISINRTYKLIKHIAASLCWRKRRAWMNGWMCALCFTLSIWQTLAGAGVLPWWYERGMKEQQGLPNRTSLLRNDKMRGFLSASHTHSMLPLRSHIWWCIYWGNNYFFILNRTFFIVMRLLFYLFHLTIIFRNCLFPPISSFVPSRSSVFLLSQKLFLLGKWYRERAEPLNDTLQQKCGNEPYWR